MNSDTLAYIGPIGAFLVALASAWFTIKRTSHEVRKTDAEAAQAEAEAGTAELNLLNDLRTETELVRKQMIALRDRVLFAEAQAARAEVARAQAQADLAVVLAKSSQERHDLKEQIAIRDGRIKVLEDKVSMLEGINQHRRHDDTDAEE